MPTSACASPGKAEGGTGRPPPPKKKQGGGRENGPHPPNRLTTPQEAAKPPIQTAPKIGPPKGSPGDHLAKTRNTKPGAAAHREKAHPKHADTHHAGTEKANKQKTQPGREGMGGQRQRNPRPGQPATDTTKPRHDTSSAPRPKKKPKGRGGANPTDGNTRTPPRHRRPPRKGGGKRGTRTTALTPQQPDQEGRGTAETRAQHARPHSTPQPGKAGYKRGAHTNTHTPQHPSQEWRGAAATQAQPHIPAPHPQPGGAGDRAARAQKHTQTPTPPQGVAGCSRNPDPSTHTQTAYQNRERRGGGEACIQPRTFQNPNQERWIAGRNPRPTANSANPSREKRGETTNRTQTHPPKTPARAGRVTETQIQAQPGPKNKRHTTVGNPVSIARALRQPVSCR